MPNPISSDSQILAKVSGDKLMESTREIAKWVRLSGEADELESFRWVEKELSSYGFETKLDHHRGYISLPEKATVRVRVSGEDRIITGISHAFATSTPAGGMTARLVDSRTLAVDSANTAESQVGATGAIVLVSGMASGSSVLHWESRGALGQIYIHDDHLHETSVSPVWGNPTEEGLRVMPSTPSLAIRQADGKWLSEKLVQGRVEVTIETEVLTEWRQIPLLTAELPGTPRRPYVLLSSHIDSWYYGAMDNGSANATTLEVARLISENAAGLRRGLRVAFWSGHSHGRFAGSAWYADNQWIDLFENCIAHVFVDSTGGMNATVVTEAPVMPQTKDLAGTAIGAVTGEEFDGKRIGRFADQSFYGIGLNSVFGTLSEQDASKAGDTISFKTGGRRSGGLGWWWHTPEDTVDKVDEKLLVRDTKIYLAVIHQLLTAPRLPFDYRPAIDEISDVVKSHASRGVSSHLNLAPLLEDVAHARRAIHDLHDRLDTLGPEADEIANGALLKLSRHLVPIAFHESGRFERDKAEPLVPVPSLRDLKRLADMEVGDVTANAIATRLHRSMNRVRLELRSAAKVAEQASREIQQT